MKYDTINVNNSFRACRFFRRCCFQIVCNDLAKDPERLFLYVDNICPRKFSDTAVIRRCSDLIDARLAPILENA